MKTLWDFLIEYQTVFASILTLITTLVVTHILRNMGKISFSFSNVDFHVSTPDGWGNDKSPNISINDISKLQGIGLSFELILYNSSNTPKCLSDFKIELIGKSNKFVLPIKDKATLKSDSRGLMFFMDELKVLNLLPKNISHHKLECSLSTQNIKQEKYKTYFICKNTKGRTIRKYISFYQFVV